MFLFCVLTFVSCQFQSTDEIVKDELLPGNISIKLGIKKYEILKNNDINIWINVGFQDGSSQKYEITKADNFVTIETQMGAKKIVVDTGLKNVKLFDSGVESFSKSKFLTLITILHDFEPYLIDNSYEKIKQSGSMNNEPDPLSFEGEEEGFNPNSSVYSTDGSCNHTIGSSYAVYGRRSIAAERVRNVVLENIKPGCSHFSWIGNVDCGCFWGDYWCICTAEYCHSNCF
jgi:hypothetical protein